jgi:hypothetical protein
MTPALVENLTKVFSENTVDERDVMYALVEVRKLMETEGIKTEFPELTFFCDWVVHPKLSGPFTQQIIMYFDDYQELFEPVKTKPPIQDVSRLTAITSLTHFQDQLISLCERFNIQTHKIRDTHWWELFGENYAAILRDCPLEIQSRNPAKHVAQVVVEALPRNSGLSVFVGGVVIRWRWKDNNNHILGEIDSFMNVDQHLDTTRN